jgi:two-component system sensor histidine kinase QseC
LWKKSLKRRLTLYVVLPVMLALLAIGGVGFYSAYNEAQEIYDTELSHVAGLMLSLLRAEDQEEAKHKHADDADEKVDTDIIELGSDFQTSGEGRERDLAFRIWKDKTLLFYSKKAADFGEERVTAGFSNQEIGGKEWRLYVLPDSKSGYTFEVAQQLKVRMSLITKVLATIFSPLILLLPVILILTWVGLRAGLKPLLAVSEAVKRRSHLDLTPLPESESLKEIEPLVNSINGLLANLDYALNKERRFTDFAAHELRTPIAIFKTQAQTALKATDDTQRRMILEAQVQAADRATNMVDQLLTLARLEHADIPTETLSLSEIAQQLVSERLPLAEQKQVVLRFEQKSSASILGNKELLTITLSNLIDNAIKYTPAHGEVVVSVFAHDNTALLCVSDTGPGIPEDKLPFVTERFYRVSRHQQPGAGLGLTIVKRASEIIGTTLILRNKDACQGLEAILEFKDNLTHV